MSFITRARIFQFLITPAIVWIWLMSWPVDLYASVIAQDGKDVRDIMYKLRDLMDGGDDGKR